MELRTEEILRITREKKRTSRVQLAKVTGLSKPTVSSIVNDLVRKGILTETGLGKSKATGGRKPINLSFSPDFKYVLSVDIGGTKAIFALLDLDGNILVRETVPSELFRNGKGILKELEERLERYIKKAGREKILGITLGIPGTVDRSSQVIKYMPSFDQGDLDLKSPLEDKYKISVLVENDVTLAAFGESWIGAAREYGDVVLVSIGTGIGAGIVIDNTVYRGYAGSAGEIGEFVTDWTL